MLFNMLYLQYIDLYCQMTGKVWKESVGCHTICVEGRKISAGYVTKDTRPCRRVLTVGDVP
jgi:hypothetical protein